ncbi:MAG TPA: hypothetical protein PKK55_01830 [Methanofastidiosum sp.]|jgi:hypothetical protein|nr:hypothetical protein [Methanofastidiosum sp.]HNZ87247.1 hypothetical protein [Methanofastidiosum sp.]HOC77587.1 hypothetical protein [Methanofastidiosum sp.]HOG74100.1 hypothetical protein [Methanofastidiosum sp.]HPA49065.1 hypothetical protein [Methanofastidiosum sp.]
MKFVVSRISKETSNPEDPPCIDAQYDSKHKFWIKEFLDIKDLMRFFSRYGDLIITENKETEMAEIVIYDDWEEIMTKLKK